MPFTVLHARTEFSVALGAKVVGLAAAFLCNSLDDRKWSQLGTTASHGAQAGTAVRDMGLWGALLLLPIAQCTATNSYTGYFWITRTATAEPGQRDMTPNCRKHR